MYYPSFFSGVRPFETMRERVDNPLDLSVKQTVSRSEISCPVEHENLQLLMERKLSTGLPSQPLTQPLPQQMPLLDNMFAFKPFGTDSMSCQMRTSDLLTPAYCSTTSSGHPLSHLSLVPEMLRQRDSMALDAGAPPLTSFTMNASGLPYHMRIGSAVMANSMANQRAYFGHNSLLSPHMSTPFGAPIPHIPLYTDLMNGLSRHSVDTDAGIYGGLSALRSAPDPTSQFSDHLQRLGGQHIQHHKCSAPCCRPSTVHQSGGSHGSNGCKCCEVGLAMPSNLSALVLPSTHTTSAVSVPTSVSMSCNDVCNRELTTNMNPNSIRHTFDDKNNENNNLFRIKSKDSEFESQSERQSSHKKSNDCETCVVSDHHLWNPSNFNQNTSSFSQKEISNKLKKESIHSLNRTQEVITLDEDISESENEIVAKKVIPNNIFETKCQTSDNQTKIGSTGPLTSDTTHDSFIRSDPISGPEIPEPLSSKTSLCQTIEEINRNEKPFGHNINKESTHSSHKSDPNQGLNRNDINLEECQTTRSLQNIEFKVNSKSCEENEVSVKPVAKQLKDYKPVAKHIVGNDKNKRQMKETKTVEVQCDGPDWTPIVLPLIIKNKLHKVVANKLFGRDSNKITSNQLMSHKKDIKKKKKSKQKHIHRRQSRSRSRSPSLSTTHNQKSCAERHLDSSVDMNSSKSKKRSMLQCLSNSEGYVAHKIKKTDLQHNLFASDPSELGREERALQRAIKHIEDLNKPYTRDNCVRNIAEDFKISQINEQINEINNNSVNSSNNRNECNKWKKLSESYQKVIESVVNESRLHSYSAKSNKNSKKANKCEESEPQFANNNQETIDTNESLNKNDLKLKPKKLSFEEILSKDKKQINKNIDLKMKKKNLQMSHKCDNKAANIVGNGTQQTLTKQKKTIVNVRRRRFRSGLDMIRSAHKRKKSRNQTQGSLSKQQSNGSITSKTNEEITQKSNCEPSNGSGNGSAPTEMKRLMVNKALGETLLHRAARSNRLDVVKSCLESNTCDVNARDNANYTPLHECSTRGNLQIARLLLQNGADVNASAVGGIRPIHDAIENNHIEVVRLLLSYGADPNISTYSGSTAIELSRTKSMLKFLRGFLSDISGESQTAAKEDVLSWKFKASSNIFDSTQMGFDVLDGLSSDEFENDSNNDFVFEMSETPMDPTFNFPNFRSKGSEHFLRLSDVLKRTRLTKEEFVKRYSQIEIVSLDRHQSEETITGQILTKYDDILFRNDGLSEEFVLLNDKIRDILGIQTLRLR